MSEAAAQRLIGIIPAAGRGVRAYPYTATLPKSMLTVDGEPILRRNLELMRDALGIREVFVVIGHHGERIREAFGDGRALGLTLHYVENHRLDLEMPWSIRLAARAIGPDFDGHCCIMLADECYVGTNHAALLDSPYRSAMATCTLIEAESWKQIRKNYQVTLENGRIVGLIEKPRDVRGNTMGTGTYLLSAEALRRLEADYAGGDDAGPRDWTGWLDRLCRSGATVLPFRLTGKYVNVNSRDDLNLANYLLRDHRAAQRRTSVVYLLDTDADSAVEPVRRFARAPEVDELVLVTRGPSRVADAVRGEPTVRVVEQAASPDEIGTLLRVGLDAATGDVLVTVLSDDTFSPRDLAKLLVYARDADLVVGTRTTRQMIEQGANMRGLVRVAHLALAKLLELCWWRFDSRFTDICCVYRAIWRSTWNTIAPQIESRGAEIFAEMVIEVLRAQRRVIEVPVNYFNHDLEQPHVRSRFQRPALFWQVFDLIVRRRAREFGRENETAASWRGRPSVARETT